MISQLFRADARHIPLADGSIHCCVTSPPYYGLRDYGVDGQIGLEQSPAEYVAALVAVFREVRRVLRDDGCLWLNLGDSYAGGGTGRRDTSGEYAERRAAQYGSGRGNGNGPREYQQRAVPDDLKPKDLIGIPWRVAFALQSDGWYLRSDIIWHKPNPMPESVTDRPTKAHEYIFLLSKSERYYYDSEAIAEPVVKGAAGSTFTEGKTGVNGNGRVSQLPRIESPTRNRRTVWTVATSPYPGAHFATYPPALVEPCILAGTSARGCCAVCGAPWERVVEPTGRKIQQHWKPGSQKAIYSEQGHNKRPSKNSVLDTGFTREMQTTGWRPTCTHDAPAVPCRVLDPFAGSGTTLAVAVEHGRDAYGCELNPEYIDLAMERLEVQPRLMLEAA